MRRPGTPLSAALFFVLSFSGCLKSSPEVPALNGRVVSEPETAQFLTAVRETNALPASVRAFTNTRIMADGDEIAVRHILLFQEPNLLRVETVPMQSFLSLQILLVTPQGGWLFDPPEKKAYSSKDPGALIRRVLKIPLSPRGVTALFTGRVNVEELQSAGVELRNDGNTVGLQSSNGLITYFFPAAHPLPAQYWRKDPFRERLALRAAFERADGGRLSRARIEFPEESLTFDIQPLRLEENATLPRDLFDPEAILARSKFDVSTID